METVFTIVPNGPIRIKGKVQIKGTDGKIIELKEGEEVELCRCGGSKKMPFCDGTHKTLGVMD